MNTKELPSAERLRELLAYDPETGVLTWKPRDGNTKWTTRYAGQPAGSLKVNPFGYKHFDVSIDKAIYKAHRVIWKMQTGSDPSGEVDHRNRDASDNKWANLRDVSYQENQLNKNINRNNTSGVSGVSWHKGAQKWMLRLIYKKKLFYSLHASLDEAKELIDFLKQELGLTSYRVSKNPASLRALA